MADKDFLARVEVCQGLDRHELGRIQLLCRPQGFREGERIFAEDQEAEDLFLLERGKVDLRFDLPGRPSDKDSTVSSVKEAGTFGWSALVPPHHYRLSAYCAATAAQVLRLAREDLLRLFDDHPRIGYRFMTNLAQVIGKRFHELQDDLARAEGFDLMDRW